MKTEDMALESLDGMMAGSMKVTGRMGSSMEWESIEIIRGRSREVSGMKERGSSGLTRTEIANDDMIYVF